MLLKIAETSVFIFLNFFVQLSSGENSQNEEKQLNVWIVIV